MLGEYTNVYEYDKPVITLENKGIICHSPLNWL